ncbi:hypothetical protein LX36DRAFT_14517 [Colletotrichum falcatum]|nr:hypothetical protein LX36DRAFT_14517 [Colletotrichum falcatum]
MCVYVCVCVCVGNSTSRFLLCVSPGSLLPVLCGGRLCLCCSPIPTGSMVRFSIKQPGCMRYVSSRLARLPSAASTAANDKSTVRLSVFFFFFFCLMS